jgi:cation transport ATPase
MFKIVKDQRQRMASEVVLQELQQEKVQSERLQPQLEQAELDKRKSEQEQSEQVQPEQVQSEQVQSEQIQSEQVQSEQEQSEQEQFKEIQSEQIKSKQKESERIELEQVQSEQNRTWLRNLAVELKAMKTFAIIVGVLTCTFLPYIVVNMVRVLAPISCPPYIIRKIVYTLVGINSIVNPFIYALRHKKYIRAYRKVFSAAWARLFSQNN